MWYIVGNITLGVWVTLVVTRSFIFSPVRELFVNRPLMYYYLECPMCFGTLVGSLLAVLYYFVRIPTGAFLVPVVSLVAYSLVLSYDLLTEILKWLANVDHKPPGTGT